jgi:hypothetical protein
MPIWTLTDGLRAVFMLLQTITQHHRWLTIGGHDILPAVAAYHPTPDLLQTWFGETPSTETALGVSRLRGWVTRFADVEEINGWLNADYNLLLHHRRWKGLRCHPDQLNKVAQLLGLECFPTIHSPNRKTITVVFTVPPMGYVPPAVIPATGIEFLSEGSLSLCAGVDELGRSPTSDEYPTWAMPPVVFKYDLEKLWRNFGGTNPLCNLQAVEGRFRSLYGHDAFAKRLHEDGWIKSFRANSADVVCPFHPNALQLARYTPAFGKTGAQFRCPYRGCTHRKLSDYVDAVCG